MRTPPTATPYYPAGLAAARPPQDPSAVEHRRAKERGIVLASAGLALALAVLMTLSLLGLDSMSLTQWVVAVALTAAVQGLLWLIPYRGWDRHLPWDRHYLYVPMVAAAMLLMFYISVAPAGRILLLMAWFTALIFMAGRVGFAGVIALSSFMAAGYFTVTASLLAQDRLTTSPPSPLVFEGTVTAVFVLINIYAGIVFERLRHEREDRRALLEDQKRSKERIERLFGEVDRSNRELRRAYDATIEGWSRAMELRDRETQGHTLRVAELTLTLARTLGVAEEDLVHIRRGALLHDIGKMAIPDNILLKNSTLDPDEWDIMRLHPSYAYELLHPIPFLRPALDIPHSHHEKWDGSGYPRGLRGHGIPLPARIFAAVDVWDALTSERPYRGPWTPERAREHIRAEAGRQFDPQIVEAFLALELR